MKNTLSARRKVGKTNLELPVFGLGTAHIGGLYKKVSEEDARETLNAAWDNGVRYYDTAPWYSRGLAELRLGGLLRAKPRNQFFLTTKVGRTLFKPKNSRHSAPVDWKGTLNLEVHFDYSYDGIVRSYEQAMMRLGLDTADALVIHDLDAYYHGDKLAHHVKALAATGMKALQELKKSGAIKAYGMGINTNDALNQTAPEFDLDFVLVAMPYTLLDQASLHTGMAACIKRKVSVIIGSPFASGILAAGSGGKAAYNYAAAPAKIKTRVRELQAVCRTHDVSLVAAALQFVLAHPAVVSAIPGAMHKKEVIENIAALKTPVRPAFWADLKAKGLIVADAPVPSGA